MNNNSSDRKLLLTGETLLQVSVLLNDMVAETTALHTEKRKRYAMVGTGARGTGMWGTEVLNNYGRYAEFVGLCDKNIGRVEYAKKIMNVSCSVFTDFETMMRETKPDMLIVATMCSTIASL